jgi:hypothetical protein
MLEALRGAALQGLEALPAGLELTTSLPRTAAT